ncbi:MAG: c-type cytochrome [Thiobacillus sp.]
MKANTVLLTLVLTLGLAACGQDKGAETVADAPAPAAPMEAAAPAMPESTDIVAAVGGEVDAQGLYGAKCAMCHGKTGEGVAGNPKLTGLTHADIASRLKDYRDGKQLGPKTAVMAATAKSLTDDQIAALSTYLGE